MSDLERPAHVDDLCLAQGEDVNPRRPLFTGDVIEGVAVQVLGDSPSTVALVGHPCAMRAGPELAPLLHVAPVVAYQAPANAVWDKHFKVMPLGDLPSLPDSAVRLDQMTLVPSSSIEASRRVFCATRPGINVLRQRLVHHLTRVVIDTRTFDEESAGAHEEVDLMEDWLTAAVDACADPAEAALDFHGWIRGNDGDRTRQAQLGDPQAVPAIRRAARREIGKRYAP